MTKAGALWLFFNSFGITAYPTEDVPDDAVFPWLTYELTLGAYGDTVSPTVELWYYGESNVPVNTKAQEISAYCRNGKFIECDGGGILVRCGTWQALRDEADDKIKRRRSVFTLDFFTTD